MIVEKDYLDFLQLLNQHHVEYLVIGGYAMIAYNEPRYTKDLDIWVKAEKTNAEKMIRVIDEFGFASLEINKEDFLSSRTFIQLGVAPVRIDLTSDISGVTFDEAFKNQELARIGGIEVPVIGIHELIKNKLISGRKQDIADAETLSKILKLKKGGK